MLLSLVNTSFNLFAVIAVIMFAAPEFVKRDVTNFTLLMANNKGNMQKFAISPNRPSAFLHYPIKIASSK